MLALKKARSGLIVVGFTFVPLSSIGCVCFPWSFLVNYYDALPPEILGWGFFTALFLGVFGIPPIYRWVQFQRARELKQDGQIVQGTIIHRATERGGFGKDYYVTYQYRPPGRDLFRARKRINPRLFHKLQVGDTVIISYPPRDPKHHKIAKWAKRS